MNELRGGELSSRLEAAVGGLVGIEVCGAQTPPLLTAQIRTRRRRELLSNSWNRYPIGYILGTMNPIRHLRLQAGVTQKKLAVLAGTSQPTIASYEAGTKSPTLETVERLAKSLGLEATIQFVPRLTREDRRSLAYHRAVVEKLRSSPQVVVAKARGNLETLGRKHPDAKRLFERWEQWLDLPLDELVSLCLDAGPLARDMRQVTPFAGLLGARERLEILQKFRKQEGAR